MNQEITQINCNQPADLDTAAKLLLEKYPTQRLFSFYGEMGAGKTTFIKSICKQLKVIDNVSSPTFAIVNVYHTKTTDEVYHFDFYRIQSLEEIYDIGYEDYFYGGQFCLMEWPERITELLPDDTIVVKIKVDQKSQSRILTF